MVMSMIEKRGNVVVDKKEKDHTLGYSGRCGDCRSRHF